MLRRLFGFDPAGLFVKLVGYPAKLITIGRIAGRGRQSPAFAGTRTKTI